MTYHFDTFTKRYLVYRGKVLLAQFERHGLNDILLAFPDIREV